MAAYLTVTESELEEIIPVAKEADKPTFFERIRHEEIEPLRRIAVDELRYLRDELEFEYLGDDEDS